MDAQSLSHLIQIIGIDIVLSGDNAVVIALACRSLPAHQQRTGVVLGAGAAVVLRIVFTVFVTFLMAVPYLKLAGGLLLFWVAYKLILPQEREGEVHAAGNLWGAVRTVLVADAVMSLDNVIAVAAAARGSVVLLVIGIAISLPLVVFGATLLLKIIARYPFIVTVGAALIGYIAGEIIVTDVALASWISANASWSRFAAPPLGALAVVLVGQFVAPLPAPPSAAQAVAAPLALFGARMLLQILGRVLVLRAPWFATVIAGALGFTGADALLEDPALSGWADAHLPLAHSLGPFVAAAAALAGVELATRLGLRRKPAPDAEPPS